ncbi:sigma-70 family RNA polymerase sigma factor [Enterococcus sp. BWB1-3]|uniref:RNA polymerase sigma factor n=1 Tax=Enterococcus sp. BWB1-3 TaxID=2787713 RepID=UPI001922C956|nr:sigma-70 family RNA polymerase sigma factor [Enterococcus sp. BWB1-3]MBL1230010.1 sigma-70 family RNA polymerase sigma factor [Enterococcus sp. BWB1-3]
MKNELQVSLVEKTKKGDAEAFVELCRCYQSVLYNSAYKLLQNNEDVSDCLQETEIIAWKNISMLKNSAAFNTWIFRIMINVAKAIVKRRIDMVRIEENDVFVEEKYYGESELGQIFDLLPEKYKIPIILHYYAGFNIKEIASQLNLPKNTVKTRLARGRERLKILLEGEQNG